MAQRSQEPYALPVWVTPKLDYTIRAYKKPVKVAAQSRIEQQVAKRRAEAEFRTREKATQETLKRQAKIREKIERRATKRNTEAREKVDKKASKREAKVRGKAAIREAKARERNPSRQPPFLGRQGVKRIITEGQLACLDCGPRPLSEFRVIARKQNGKVYYDSRCHPCRKTRSAARNQNVSPAAYRAMIEAAGGKCAICGQTTKLVLDHCHATGRLRGVLCVPCNLALSPLENDPDIVMRMGEYLRYWRDLPTTDAEKAEGIERERRRKCMVESSKRMKAKKSRRTSSSTATG